MPISSRKKLFMASAAVLGLLFLFFLTRHFWQQRQVEEYLSLQESVNSPDWGASPADQRQKAQQRLAYLEKQFTQGQKEAAFPRSREIFGKRLSNHFRQILEKNPSQLAQELDQVIDGQERARGQKEKNAYKNGAREEKKSNGSLRNEGISQLLDQTTPELRHWFNQYVLKVNERRAQRGLPPWNPLPN